MTKINLYETRLMFWSSALGLTKFVNYFLYRKCSPFMITYNGFNSLHIAAQKGQFEILKIYLEGEYIYQEFQEVIQKELVKKKQLRQHTFNKKRCLNMLTSQMPSNALHLAIESENYQCMRLLFEHKVSTKKFNHRTLRPFELTFNEKIVDFYSTNVREDNPTNFQQQGYQYVIQVPGKRQLTSDIVYLQLLNISETFKKFGWKFEFLILKSPNLNELNKLTELNSNVIPKYIYYIIKMSPNTIYQLADKYKLRCYNLKKKYISSFVYSERMFFEFPKDIQIQMMLINTFNEEFDLDKFVLEGLILSHFPLQDQKKSEDIYHYWLKYQTFCIRNTIRINSDQRALVPLNNIANYYGPVIGWYFAFITQLVGQLILPSIFGIFIALYVLITQDYFSKLIPLYAFFMALWSTFFIEKWRNRTWELKFSWDMHDFKENEPTRVMYKGQFILDSISSKISIKDKFPTFQRRLITDIPIIFLGLCFITVTFFIFYQWNKDNEGNTIMTVFINSLNGTCLTLLSSLYKLLCRKLIEWENHKFESEKQFSYIVKVYLFEFLNSYITVFYYAVFEEDALKLALSVASIVITRGQMINYYFLLFFSVIQNVTSNIVPFIRQKIKLKIFRQNFNNFRSLYSILSIKPETFEIDDQQHISEKIPPELIIDFIQQLEELVIREPQKLLFDEYTSIAIQYGYITMFSPSFPGAPVFFMINTYINLRLSLFCYKNVMKRQKLLPADSLGIWDKIFAIMNYAATFMNCIVIGRANKSQLANLIGPGSLLRDIIILVAVEHVILLIKYILETLMPDIPYWVQKELKRYKYQSDKYSQ